MTPAATGTVSPAAIRRSAATTPGANSLFLTARTSSVRRSRPIRCEAGASTPASAVSPPSLIAFWKSAMPSNTRQGMRVSKTELSTL